MDFLKRKIHEHQIPGTTPLPQSAQHCEKTCGKKQRSFCKERKLTDCSSNPCYSPSFCPYDCTHLVLIHRWESPIEGEKSLGDFPPKPANQLQTEVGSSSHLCQCLITIVFSFHICILIKKISHVDKVSLVHVIL